MTAVPTPLSTKDNASGRLNSTLTAIATSVVLQSGNGANFPQAYNGTASSSGSSTTLNSTGILAAVGGSSSAMAGKFIWNKTDGSIAIILSVATNALTCTRLLGGTDNTWDSADVWCIDPFVVTFGVLSTSSYGVQSDGALEEALVIGRSTDTLTVATGGRGYNSTSAAQFSSGDYVYLRSTSPIVERFKDILSVVMQQYDTDRTTLATAGTNITNLQTGAYHYVVATGSSNAYVAATPALAALAAGNIVRFKANHTNTGAATLNLNGLGATAIKKNDGATALSAGDIISGQVVTVVYDGTNFQMVSPVGTPPTTQVYEKVVYLSGASSSAQTNPTSDTAFDTHTYTIPANDLVSGVGYEIEAWGTCTFGTSGSLALSLRLAGSAVVTTNGANDSGTQQFHFKGMILGTAAAGASVAVRSAIAMILGEGSGHTSIAASDYASGNQATNGTLALTLGAFFTVSNGSNSITLTMVKITKISSSLFS